MWKRRRSEDEWEPWIRLEEIHKNWEKLKGKEKLASKRGRIEVIIKEKETTSKFHICIPETLS